MAYPKLVGLETWLEARRAFLEREKAFTRARDALSAARRELPSVVVDKSYLFDTPNGRKSLGELFGPHRQLIVYHFMFGETWQEGCPSCSFWADNYERLDVHLAAQNTAFVTVSSASLEKLQAYAKRMNWSFNWVSAAGNGFGEDFGVTYPARQDPTGHGYNYTGKVFGEEMPGVSTFLRLDDGRIAHSYSTYGRGIDMLNMAYNLLDLTPLGRQEDDLPQPMSWVRRRDRYTAEA